ncbi:twin-arginine translocase TatA/TatE family subunit [Georgenia satyanarayanai]|uniref:twin-arginine translocase TatA/TatE family subunit n=1 Tax=Georgenia satyanarayanai TaxID=860221 RepID=UPI00221F361B|nr:twin-arginine translocase TatA/TatE family subunit [Georgenia satyanarayanai]
MLQILIIVLIIVVLFGAKRLPDVASSIGKSLKIFKKEVTELREDDTTPPSGPVSGGPTSPSTTPNPTTAPPSADDHGTTPPGGAGR